MKTMKRIVLLFVALISNQLMAQTCPNGFTAMNQGALDNFTTLYPGCTSINGTLFIGGTVENLDALSQITEVTGGVILGSENPNFNISGLSSLTTVGGSLEIVAPLTSVAGLSNVTTVGQNLRIMYCASLSDLSPLNGIQSIGLNLEVVNNVLLTNFNVLNNITTVPGFINIAENPLLNAISGLNSLTNIESYMRLVGNSELGSIAGFGALSSIGDYLLISNADALVTLTGLENLSAVGTYITLSSNNVLSSIAALNSPISLGTYINLANNPQLSDCAVEAVCNAMDNPNIELYVVGNAPGCNTINQVEDACDCAGQNLDYAFAMSACGSYTFLDVTYTESGTYLIPYTTVSGCTGIATLYLNLVELEYEITVVDSTFTISGNFGDHVWVDCLNNFEPIPGAILNTFVGSSSGSYAAIIESGTCTLQTDCYQAIEVEEPVGILDFEKDLYHIYPNPSSGVIHIDIAENVSVSVYNLFGKQVETFLINQQASSIDLSHLSSGTYFLVLSHSSGQFVERVIISTK